MADDSTISDRLSEPTDARDWLADIAAAGQREKTWRQDADAIERLYSAQAKVININTQVKRLNILWSNTETLKASLTPQLGSPDVRRLFPRPGQDDKVARTASLVIERALLASSGSEDDEQSEFEDGVQDMLLAGRGQVWLEYDVELSPDGMAIARQDARLVLVPWVDFRHGHGKRWRDVPWVARRHLFTRDDLRAKFPDHADQIPLGYTLEQGEQLPRYGEGMQNREQYQRAAVWELWDKRSRQRVYVAEGYSHVLRMDPDPYRVKSFFPCPKPLYSTAKGTSSLTPRPEFMLYKDQADDLDKVVDRLSMLTDALKHCGVYNAASADVDKLAQIGSLIDNEFLPVKDFAAFQGGGGSIDGNIWTRPIDRIASVIQFLEERQDRLVQQIYEITGISDIIRGVTDPREALGTHRIKAQFGSLRLQSRQRSVQRWVRDAYRIKAEVIAEHFTREALEDMTGVPLPPAEVRDRARMVLQALAQQQAQPQVAPGQAMPGQAMGAQVPQMDPDQISLLRETAEAPSWEEVSAILRSDARRAHKVDIETDATALEDSAEDKAARSEYLGAVKQMMSDAVPAIQQNPDAAPLFKAMFGFASRGYRIGRTLEQSIEDAIDQTAKKARDGQGSPPPAMMIEQQKLAIEMQRVQNETKKLEIDQMRVQVEMAKLQAGNAREQVESAAEHSKAAAQIQAHAFDLEGKRADLASKQASLAAKLRDLHGGL